MRPRTKKLDTKPLLEFAPPEWQKRCKWIAFAISTFAIVEKTPSGNMQITTTCVFISNLRSLHTSNENCDLTTRSSVGPGPDRYIHILHFGQLEREYLSSCLCQDFTLSPCAPYGKCDLSSKLLRYTAVYT